MAHRRGSFRRGISESQRRKKVWSPFSGPTVESDLVSSGDPTNTLRFISSVGATLTSPQSSLFGFVFDTGFAELIEAESTLLRIRGSLQMDKNSAGSTLQQTFAFGIGVMETGAAQQIAFPNPSTPAGSNWDGWMFYRSVDTGILDATGAIVDVKSMRKIQSGMSLVFAYGATETNTTVGGAAAAPALNAQFTARGLFLLP